MSGGVGTAGRVAWIDASRGFLVILVVVGHALMFLGRADMPVTEIAPSVRVAQLIRIPALFFLSGALFSHAAARPWRTVIGTRIVPMVWILGVWLLVEVVLASWRVGIDQAMPAGPARWLLAQVMIPEDYLWFIWGLAVMTVVARLLRSHPVLIVAVAAAMLLTPVYPELGGQTEKFFSYAPFYLLGFLVAPALRVRQRWLVGAGAISALIFVPLALARTERGLVLTTDRLDEHLLTFLGLPAVALLGIVLTRLPGARMWNWLGRRTLAIYVAHMPLLVLARWKVVGTARRYAEPYDHADLLFLVLLVIVVVALCALLHVVCDRLPFDGILAEPRWLRRLVRGDGGSGGPTGRLASSRQART
ncbi:acyltransferase family protein [Georgenia sp. Z1491]|uniref:acyltransferase family protein n=1 Tax=Georgenia sp. Z1491 TaxID=3416707 RepID=UPI003CECC773